jgi:hypothetical protein
MSGPFSGSTQLKSRASANISNLCDLDLYLRDMDFHPETAIGPERFTASHQKLRPDLTMVIHHSLLNVY